MLPLPPEVAVDVRDTGGIVIPKASNELVHNDRCENRLSGSRNAWTEKRLLTRG